MSGVGVVVVEVEVCVGGLDSRQGPRFVLAERLQGNAVAWRVRACVCGRVKNTFNLMTVMKLEVSANDFFTAI